MRWGLCLGERALAAGGLLAVAVGPSGCGGDGGNSPPSCLQVQPCGGDLVGTWSFLGGCIDAPALNAETPVESCPDMRITGGNIAIAGSATYGADLTYSFEVEQTITLTSTFPLSCTTATSCSEYAAGVMPGASASGVTCVGTTTCACRQSFSIPRTVVTGTYTTAGPTIQLTSSASGVTTSSYCVQGDLLHLMTVSGTQTGPMGEAVILVDDVAQKQ